MASLNDEQIMSYILAVFFVFAGVFGLANIPYRLQYGGEGSVPAVFIAVFSLGTFLLAGGFVLLAR